MPTKFPSHRPKHLPSRAEREQHYDKRKRNKESKAFYHSSAWVKVRIIKLAQSPLCELCYKEKRLVPASIVHHIIEIEVDPYLRLDMDNMQSLCSSCHTSMHKAER